MTTITALPTAPTRSMAQSVFTSATEAFLTALPTFVTQTNTVAGEVNTNATNAANSATSAATSAATATAQATIASNSANSNGSSTTASTPALGALSFVFTQSSRNIALGQRFLIASNANPTTNWSTGVVTAWNSGTNTVTFNIDAIGTTPVAASDWNLTLSGVPGVGATLATATLTFGASGTLLKSAAGGRVASTTTSALALDKAANLQNGWSIFVAPQDFVITFTANGSETIALYPTTAATSKAIPIGSAAVLSCDGVGFTLTLIDPFEDAGIEVHTGNGVGSTNTAVRRFTTTKVNIGTSMTLTQSATLGDSITVNKGGTYIFVFNDTSNGQNFLSVNASGTEVTTSAFPAEAHTLLYGQATNTPVLWVGRLSVGDVVRAQTTGTASFSTTAGAARFIARKIGP